MIEREEFNVIMHCLGVRAEQEVCEECPVYHESGIACREAARAAISALEELQQYREIGTVEEFREAREKQMSKKCYIESFHDHTRYKCPSCGQIQMSTYAHGFPRLGRITKYCENCGQALLNENLEGMRND